MVYLGNIALMLFWNIVIPETAKNKRKKLCMLYCLQWVLLSGLRAYTVGADTYSYKINSFDVIYVTSWDRIFDTFFEYLHGIAGIKDPGYLIFEKICQLFIGESYTLFLLIIACVFTIPMAVWIYKYSDNVCLSFVIYSALFYSFFAITGHRQTIATALVVFGGYACMKKDKFFPLLLLHFVAFFIHKSSICFLLLYFAKYVRINKLYWSVSIGAIALSFIFRRQFMAFLGELLGYESYVDWNGTVGAYTFTLLLTLLYLATMLLYRKLPQNVDTDYAVVALTLAMVFVSFTYVNPSAMRVVQYFSLFIMILVPKFLQLLDARSRFLTLCVCYAVLILPLVSKMPEYAFVFS